MTICIIIIQTPVLVEWTPPTYPPPPPSFVGNMTPALLPIFFTLNFRQILGVCYCIMATLNLYC